jgi:hypothetical protein
MEKEDPPSITGEGQPLSQPPTPEKIPNTTNTPPESEAPSTTTEPTTTNSPLAPESLTGLKLAAVLAAVTMAAFLMILDLSVIVTVSHCHFHCTLLTFTSSLLEKAGYGKNWAN